LQQHYAAATIGDADVSALLELLDKTGAQMHTAARARAFHTAALAALDRAHGTAEATAALRAMATRLLDRQT
jgi:geranylgeranyl pyrophosphate synthase